MPGGLPSDGRPILPETDSERDTLKGGHTERNVSSHGNFV